MIDIKGFSVLVVDDEPDLGELVAFEFEMVGANVYRAENALEALKVAADHNIDVVVSDIMMPGGDGVQLLTSLRKINPLRPPLIFMTGFSNLTLEEAYDKGAVAMFGKPFNRNELIEVVSKNTLPLDKKWNSFDQSISVVKELEYDLPNLNEQSQVKFGRGGLFLECQDLTFQISDRIKFKLLFSEGKIKLLKGVGIVRWVRRSSNTDGPKGLGIEIESLTNDCKSLFIDFIYEVKPIAYIPKS